MTMLPYDGVDQAGAAQGPANRPGGQQGVAGMTGGGQAATRRLR
jgi:hypothetical protein